MAFNLLKKRELKACVQISTLAVNEAWNTNQSGRLNTVDLLIRIACFVKSKACFQLLTKRQSVEY